VFHSREEEVGQQRIIDVIHPIRKLKEKKIHKIMLSDAENNL